MRLVIFEISEDTNRCIQGIAAPRGAADGKSAAVA